MKINDRDEYTVSYRDDYFAKGHWLRKIWQTLIAIICWAILLVPCIVTIGTYVAYITDGHHGFFFWRYQEGFSELDLLIVLLLVIGLLLMIFCLVVGGIQNRRRKHVIEKTPLYDVEKSDRQLVRAERLATERFGNQKNRYAARYYRVSAEQNFANEEFRKHVQQGEVEEK